MPKLKKTVLILAPLLFALACGGIFGDDDSDGLTLSGGDEVQCAEGAVVLDLIYAPEEELYMDGEVYDAIKRENRKASNLGPGETRDIGK